MPSASSAPLYDAAALDRVRHLHLRARQATEGVWLGARRSIRTGHDVEFMDYKPYDVGDALRDLDWKVLGRTDRLLVRRYRAETEQRTVLVFDASADLGSTPAKWETALTLVASLAWLMQVVGEPVGLYLAGGEGAHLRWLPPRGGRSHVARLFLELAALRPAGRAGLDAVLHEVGARLGPRSLVLLVSDFMEEPSTWGRSLAALRRRRADVRALHLYDPRELTFDGGDPVRLRSPEDGRHLPVDPRAVRPAFEAELERYFGEVRAALAAERAQHLAVPAGADLAEVLAALLAASPLTRDAVIDGRRFPGGAP